MPSAHRPLSPEPSTPGTLIPKESNKGLKREIPTGEPTPLAIHHHSTIHRRPIHSALGASENFYPPSPPPSLFLLPARQRTWSCNTRARTNPSLQRHPRCPSSFHFHASARLELHAICTCTLLYLWLSELEPETAPTLPGARHLHPLLRGPLTQQLSSQRIVFPPPNASSSFLPSSTSAAPFSARSLPLSTAIHHDYRRREVCLRGLRPWPSRQQLSTQWYVTLPRNHPASEPAQVSRVAGWQDSALWTQSGSRNTNMSP